MVTLTKPRHEDQVECELAAVDQEFHDLYGPEHLWAPWQRDTYLDAIARARETRDFAASAAAGFTESLAAYAARITGGAA
ncbi:hypothetical protein [Streptomyces sp. NRRL F-5630]|uniref:hypothetical protein n=1 Tax=Streptomyces sp. NRRL F-5630 TaxID=1463864 RepID=UPI003EBE3486